MIRRPTADALERGELTVVMFALQEPPFLATFSKKIYTDL
jgi:hypothetical protein